MTAEDDVRRRVGAFVSDYHERWSRSGSTAPPGSSGFGFGNQAGWVQDLQDLDMTRFNTWRDEVTELEATHGTPALETGLQHGLSMHPAHDPASESILDVEVARTRATARSSMEGNVQQYYEYRLRLIGGDWRIDRVVMSLDAPGVPVMQSEAAALLLTQSTDDASLPELSEHVELDVELLFTPGRQVRVLDEELTTDVRQLGTLTTSGVLAVVDLGYVSGRVAVLTRRVPPGSYPVQVAAAGPTNTTLRLRLTDRRAVEHRVAGFTDGTRDVSVDAGNVVVADASALLSAEASQVAAAYQEHTQSLIEGRDVAFGLGGSGVDAVMVNSGFGDGGYPCYWGLDADGALAELVVDFVVLADDIDRVTSVPFAVGVVEDPAVAPSGLLVAEEGGGYLISHRESSYLRWLVAAPDGTVLVESGRLGSFVSMGVSSSTWTPAESPPPGSVLEVTEILGYRHV